METHPVTHTTSLLQDWLPLSKHIHTHLQRYTDTDISAGPNNYLDSSTFRFHHSMNDNKKTDKQSTLVARSVHVLNTDNKIAMTDHLKPVDKQV